ncbi:MAG: transcriptional regulator GcvA [Pseudomonadota bacterium]
MARALPPLNALKAFEAAGRHLSFTKAAGELNVTAAAVSHHVKALEEALGTPLFHRLTRALRLTEAGQAALPLLGAGFDKLTEAVEQIRAHAGSTLLTLSVSPSFGALWLVPRLERFRLAHPEVEIRLDGTDRRVDVARGEADLALRYGPGGYEGVCVDKLFDQVNTPVCSPALVQGSRALRRPADLRHHTLLHIDWKAAEPSWRMWLLAAGVSDVDAARGPRFTMESMAVDAALDGQGVALVGDMLVSDHLAAGRLVRPFGPELSTRLSFSYYLLSAQTAVAPKVAAFRDWLLAEAREIRERDTVPGPR